MPEAEDLPGRLRETDRAIGGVSIHLIRTHCGKDLAKAVVALKAASQEAASEIERLTTRLQSLEDENARLLGEVEEANRQRCRLADRALAEAQRAQAAEAALALAREGLEPFARIGRAYNSDRWGHVPDDHTYAHNVSVANYRRAAQVYASIKDGGEG